MSSTRAALTVIAVVGVVLFALSFINGWIVHDREIRGEGYRHSEIVLGAWRSVAVPVLTIGAVAALATAAAAAARLAGWTRVPGWLILGGAITTLACVGASFVPLGWDGHTTSIDLRPSILSWVGALLAATMVVAAAMLVAPSPRTWAVSAGALVVLLALAVGGRWGTLTLAAPSNQVWSDGTYALAAGGDAYTLVISGGRYRIGEHWAGTWVGSGGWTVALDEDPACPDSRGAYHAREAGPDGVDLRFVKIVDTCEDGARAEVLESGIWERRP